MAYRDLGQFVEALESRGLLKRISVEVDPVLEITEITDRVSKAGGPALLFEKVRGSEFPVLMNSVGTKERLTLAFGRENLEEIGEELLGLLNIQGARSFMDKMKALPLLMKMSEALPKVVRHAPCQEVIEKDPDLNRLPILKCWPKDGGRFITLPMVFTRDPKTGRRNVGMYRMQVYDARTTGMHWHIHKDGARHFAGYQKEGRRMEVAVAIGCDPVTVYASTAPLPPDVDEMLFAGLLRGEAVEMVRAKTVDIEVPAHAEFILEGYIDPSESRMEGPFGDHTGHYSLPAPYPVFHVTCITRKKNPIYHATVVGRPPMEDCFMAKATERIFLPFIRMLLPEIRDMNLPVEGAFHNCAIISIEKSYPGQARRVMHALWGLGQLMHTKVVIVVDGDVDVQDIPSVAWKVLNNIDPRRDVILTDGTLDVLDHSAPYPCFGAKIGVDATRKWPGEGIYREWPEETRMTEEIKSLVTQKWAEYGIE
ncbi:MAG TPA: menaquinone biosynthesis decarboxylase [Firmicutes bacterium]|nr:menaquinone biosynthesis decarboxylase [Bacillota bacterium]